MNHFFFMRFNTKLGKNAEIIFWFFFMFEAKTCSRSVHCKVINSCSVKLKIPRLPKGLFLFFQSSTRLALCWWLLSFSQRFHRRSFGEFLDVSWWNCKLLLVHFVRHNGDESLLETLVVKLSQIKFLIAKLSYFELLTIQLISFQQHKRFQFLSKQIWYYK